jgi:hypothetical protein
VIRFATALALVVLLPTFASGQAPRSVTLAVTGANTSIQNPTRADYDAGFVTDATPVTWTATVNSPRTNCTYTATVQMRATGSTIGNSKSIADVTWSNGGAFTALTTSYVTVGTAALTSGTRSSSGTLTFRIALDWTEESASFNGAGLQFLVSATSSGTGC